MKQGENPHFFYAETVSGHNFLQLQMSKVNLNFKEFFVDNHEYDLIGPAGSVKKIDYALPKEYKKFFSKQGFCPFCKEKLNKVYNNSKTGYFGADLFESIDIWECDCGYWDAFSSFSEEKDYIGKVDAKHWEKRYYSIIGNVEDRKKEKAVRQLISELKTDNSKVFKVAAKRFEEIAQYVFSAYFECEVEHVGKSHDGGVDLLIVKSEKPILVQAKRRTKSNAVENVSTVRDFLGAMYIKNNFNGIIVSTAKHFSRPAKKVIESLENENRLEYFELFDFKKFFSVMDSVNISRQRNWEFLTESWKK